MMDVYEENPRIYISYEDLAILQKMVFESSTMSMRDIDNWKRILDSYTGQQLETLKEFCIYQHEINYMNKQIAKLMRERDILQDVLDEDRKLIIFPGDEFNDILPNEKGETNK